MAATGGDAGALMDATPTAGYIISHRKSAGELAETILTTALERPHEPP